MLMILLLTLYQQLNNKIIVLFKTCLLIIMFNIFNIELIDIYFKIKMIENIIVLNIYNLMKILNL